MAFLRTTLLLSLLTGILLAVGLLLGGTYGMTIALIVAFVINIFSYWFSDKIVLAMYGAKPTNDKMVHNIVDKLCKDAKLPKPKIYIVESDIANAFATGRNPKNSAVAVTRGLLENLEEDEIEGVLAHEISHIKNRDTLVSTIAAIIGGAIAYLAQIAWYSVLFHDRRNNSSLILFPFIILAPLAATLVRLAVSREREYGADYTGALISRNPDALASALEKISVISSRKPLKGNVATSHLWIVNPFKADSLITLFSTHPPIESRVKRLRAMKINA